MQDIVSPLQSISYTKKDFQTIYPELLDLVKQLTNKWDPTISNESDPGVVLIKLNALIADKCNYNIDKNVLECFPLSVTQEQNARQLFEQLGYYMKWYNSASTYLALKWIGQSTDDVTFTIPEFTMVTDAEKTVVYTLTGYLPSSVETAFNVNSMILPANGSTINVKAIQGVAVKFDINGDTVITPQHLDSNNRIYFNAYNVAQNGIFITNVGSTTNYSSWIQKDNLLVEEPGNTYYKFGITNNGSTCYIEFPEDANEIMKEGIQITYILSDGSYGNVSASQLSNFYSDLSVISSAGESVVLNAQNVKINNYFASYDGKDPENIDSAYNNYKRTVGTFNTLVTIRDYLNYILTNKLASNGFVCDRTNDIQNTYQIRSNDNGISKLHTIIEADSNDDPVLTAFSLKLYLTNYYQIIQSASSFNNTFQLLNTAGIQTVQAYLEDSKSVQHDFVELDRTSDIFSHICYFKNKYPLDCTIIPQYTLSVSAKTEVQNNIKRALYENLNAIQINFGETIQEDYLYNIILNADDRIKTVMLDNLSYNTYAVYYDETGALKELQVSGNIENSCDVTSSNANLKAAISVDTNTFISELIDSSAAPYSSKEFTYSSGSWNATLADYGITITGYSPVNNDSFTVQASKVTQFRNEILTKSILAGITPFLIEDESIDYRYDQKYNGSYSLLENVKSLEANTNITLSNSFTTYTLKDNESIQLYSPNLLQQNVYNNYVKFECNFIDTVAADTYYQIRANEYIIFYWKSSSSASIYQYQAYGEGCIIKSSFMLSSNNLTQTSQDIYVQLNSISVPKMLSSQESMLYPAQSNDIMMLTDTNNILSDNKEIANYVKNSVTLSSNTYCYWVLNEVDTNNNYVLFNASNNPQSRILEQGEYFFYTNATMSELISLGAGTEISITNSQGVTWSVKAVDVTDITLYGFSALQDYWFIPNVQVTAVEQTFLNVNAGYTFYMIPKDTTVTSWSCLFSSSGATFTPNTLQLQDFTIRYKQKISDSEWITIPNYNFVTDLSWKAKSFCSINVSQTDEQILYSNQTVKLTYSDDTTITLVGADISTLVYSCVFRSSIPITLSVASSIDISYYNATGEIEYPSIYVYQKQLSVPASVSYVDDGMNVYIASSSTSSSEIEFLLQPGDYIIPVQIPDLESSATAIVEIDDTAIYPIYDNTVTQLNSNTSYPLYFHADNSYTHTLKVTLSSAQSANIYILVKNVYKYYQQSDIDIRMKLIRLFDQNNLFDYTYKIDDSIKIIDPLDALSFLNINHIYNKYTICQFDTSNNSKLRIT